MILGPKGVRPKDIVRHESREGAVEAACKEVIDRLWVDRGTITHGHIFSRTVRYAASRHHGLRWGITSTEVRRKLLAEKKFARSGSKWRSL